MDETKRYSAGTDAAGTYWGAQNIYTGEFETWGKSKPEAERDAARLNHAAKMARQVVDEMGADDMTEAERERFADQTLRIARLYAGEAFEGQFPDAVAAEYRLITGTTKD